jgi:hypothetical protein
MKKKKLIIEIAFLIVAIAIFVLIEVSIWNKRNFLMDSNPIHRPQHIKDQISALESNGTGWFFIFAITVFVLTYAPRLFRNTDKKKRAIYAILIGANLAIVGGQMDSGLMDKSGVEGIAKLPSLLEIRGTIARILIEPAARLARVSAEYGKKN